MPLERRVQPPRTYQRTHRGNLRHQPYCLPTNVSESQTDHEILEQRTREGHEEDRQQLDKRGSHVCTPRNEPIQTEDAYTVIRLGDEAEEGQRISNHWMETNGNQSTWQIEQSSRVSPNFIHTSHSNLLSEIRDVDTVAPDPADDSTSDTLLSSMIPNTVHSPNSTRLPLSESPHTLSHSSPNEANCLPTENVSRVFSSTCVRGLHTVSTTRELSNHDRSVEERSRSLLKDYESSPISSLLVCVRSMPTMPPLSAHALQVANRVIRHARHNKTLDERFLWCPDCSRLPIQPITGPCGHTRCIKCIQDHGACPCGVQAPNSLHINTVIQDLIIKMVPKEACTRVTRAINDGERPQVAHRLPQNSVPEGSRCSWHANRSNSSRCLGSGDRPDVAPRLLLSLQTRFEHARRLLASGRYRDAAPHLARVAVSSEPIAQQARSLLAQTIEVLSSRRDPRRLTRDLYRAVRVQSASTWLKPTDLECVLCYHSYTSPVTTPCGHTYCRTCIERSMDYRKSCALCLRSLDDFDLASTRETVFICAALSSIDALNAPPPPDPDVIPIFVCTVAYPTIPCPLFIFDPRYWMMIRRVLESGSRKFGMVAYERDRTYSDYGTVLEVCDCVHLEDGRTILSTVGVSRFRVIERDVRDGCDVARIQPLTDITPTEELVIWELRIMATQISYKAFLWLNSMNRTVRSEIEAAFGPLPHFDRRQEDWWESPDGPAWLWWLIAILPLRSEIKILILSTKSLLKRMMAVSRTLEAIDQVTISATATSECELRTALTNTEEWLERSA